MGDDTSMNDTKVLDELVSKGQLKAYEFVYANEGLELTFPDGSRVCVSTHGEKISVEKMVDE